MFKYYKRMFTLGLKSELGPEGKIPGTQPEGIFDYEIANEARKDAPVEDLINDIKKDGKIDGKDLDQINLLGEQLSKEKEDVYASTKEAIHESLLSMLTDGYTVKTEEAFLSLKAMLSLSGSDIKLGDYYKIKNTIPNGGRFSLVYNEGSDYVLVYRDQETRFESVNGDEHGYIKKGKGEFIEETNLLEFYTTFDDDFDNNNNFKADGVDTALLNDTKNIIEANKYNNLSEYSKINLKTLNNDVTLPTGVSLYEKTDISSMSTDMIEKELNALKLHNELVTILNENNEIEGKINTKLEEINQLQGNLKLSATSLIQLNIANPQIDTLLKDAESKNKTLESVQVALVEIQDVIERGISVNSTDANQLIDADLSQVNDIIQRINRYIEAVKVIPIQEENIIPTQSENKTEVVNLNSQLNKAKDWYKGKPDIYTKEVIKTIQEKLIENKYLAENEAEGFFGEKTFDAIVNFQKNEGLSQDGKAGKNTLEKLGVNTKEVNEAKDDSSFLEKTGDVIEQTYEDVAQWIAEVFGVNNLAHFIGANGEEIGVEYDAETKVFTMDTTFSDGVRDYDAECKKDCDTSKLTDQKSAIAYLKGDILEEFKKEYDQKVLEQAISDITSGKKGSEVIDSVEVAQGEFEGVKLRRKDNKKGEAKIFVDLDGMTKELSLSKIEGKTSKEVAQTIQEASAELKREFAAQESKKYTGVFKEGAYEALNTLKTQNGKAEVGTYIDANGEEESITLYSKVNKKGERSIKLDLAWSDGNDADKVELSGIKDEAGFQKALEGMLIEYAANNGIERTADTVKYIKEEKKEEEKKA